MISIATRPTRNDQQPMRILLVGEARSIHAARFIALLQALGYDARLFHVDQEGFFEDQTLAGTIVYMPFFEKFRYTGRNKLLVSFPIPFEFKAVLSKQAPLRALVTLCTQAPFRLLARLGNANRPRVYDFVRVMRSFVPDVVISARMQTEGYLVAAAKLLMGNSFRVPWIHFVWGTDIEFFGKDEAYRAEHLPLIRQALATCDYLLTDTQRDADQAPAFGFRGKHLGVFPAHGGFDPDWLDGLRSSVVAPRNIIFVKGREGSYVGRAMNIVTALGRLAPRLTGYKIMVLLATPNVRSILPEFARQHGLTVEALEYVPYDELMRVYGRSRLAISATTVDGTPSFLTEAMAMGALPIHSDMASIREWIDDGENGLLFPVDDVDALERAIIRGLTDDELFRRSEARNRALIDERVNRNKVGSMLGHIIEDVVKHHGPAATSEPPQPG